MHPKEKKSYKDTLNLPTTTFSIRAHAATQEPALRQRWNDENLAEKVQDKNKGNKRFVLHDGPPYANGHIHIGTAYNKIAKDITVKFRRMAGFHAPYLPGWDCHGLPIELKVLAHKQLTKDPTLEQKIDFKKTCRKFAKRWIATQTDEFKELGVLADWRKRYETMNPVYQADIIRAFATLVEKGYIERKGRTVPWCQSCKTVLANAEIEHKDRKDPSIYVLFAFDAENARKIFADLDLFKHYPNLTLSLLIWTTTPWTIPLNRAVILHPTATYVILAGKRPDTAFIVAKELMHTVCQKVGIACTVLDEFKSELLDNKKVQHPLLPTLYVPIILDQSVMLKDGTAVVHSAPGCGPEDYLIGVRNHLEIYSPLSDDGKYTQSIQPAELEGMSINDGQNWVIKKLLDAGKLLYKESISHAYPHCWRCHNGLLFRATNQWFCNLRHTNMIDKAIEEIETNIKFIPDSGKKRLQSCIQSRTEWCISRQRQWGTPIIALLCAQCDTPYITADMIRIVASGVEKEGIEYWDALTISQLQEYGALPDQLACKACNATLFVKEKDILDVWFDAGVSHFAVLSNNTNLQLPADLYLEGSDQHRGWFQSSLLTSMILHESPNTRAILTHGYVVDKHGQKMSKSLGNVIAPSEVIKNFSADILRLWVASTDAEKDMVISDKLLKNVAEVYKKIRNTCRFMVANLYDFDLERDEVNFDALLVTDKMALAQLHELHTNVIKAYKSYKYTTVQQLLGHYCTVNLSSFYLDIAKDRLYIEKPDSLLRRSAQTTLFYILDNLTKLMAPILSYLAEEVSDHYQSKKQTSIHMQLCTKSITIWQAFNTSSDSHDQQDKIRAQNFVHADQFIVLEKLRDAVLKAIEQEREKGSIKHSLQAKLILYLEPENINTQQVFALLDSLKKPYDAQRFLKDWFIVSQVEICNQAQGFEKTELSWFWIHLQHADGVKCLRCWQWDFSDHEDELCKRCIGVLS